jgi:hypothetical protein
LHPHPCVAARLRTAQRIGKAGLVPDPVDEDHGRFAGFTMQLRRAVTNLIGVEAHPFKILATRLAALSRT